MTTQETISKVIETMQNALVRISRITTNKVTSGKTIWAIEIATEALMKCNRLVQEDVKNNPEVIRE